jgi:endonuclease G
MLRSRRSILLILLLLLGLAVGIRPFATQARPALISLHLTLGNPSGAVPDPAFPANYLIDRAQNAMAYQRDAGIPAWVSWHLEAADIGGVGRGNFAADTSLPAGWYQILPSDYTGSGYDRGHMTPSGDRTSSRAANDETFLMTNIIPQAPDNNQGPWANLENDSRAMLGAGNELYIISGGSGSLGTLAGGKLQIPAVTWKVIVVLPVGDNDASRVTTGTRVIGIWMPNVQGIRSTQWESYRVSVDFIESQTGFDFLSLVPEPIQAVVEAQVDGGGPGSTATPPPPSLTPTSTPTGTLPTPTATTVPPTSTPTATAGTPTATTPPGAAGVVISQVYGGGGNAGALFSHDFIEVFNAGSSPVSLAGWSVQYASASGNTWQKTDLPPVTLDPGQYLLVQEALGGSCSSPCVALPQPDATGSIAMSGTSGKVVLATVSQALSGTCPVGPTVRDTVGYGSAGCYEGAGAAPALSSTTAAMRAGLGCIDSDQNAADFAAAAPAPRTSESAQVACQPTATATPTATTGLPTSTATATTPTATATTPTATATTPTATVATPTATTSTATATTPTATTSTATATTPTATTSTATATLSPVDPTWSVALPLLVR